MIPYQIREGSWNEPIAMKTKIGWAIYGRDGNEFNHSASYSCHICECSEAQDTVENLFRKFQSTESFGVTAPQKQLRSKDDENALNTFEKTLNLTNGRYEIGLLWKEPNVHLPYNQNVAMRRLICFEQKLQRDSILKAAVVYKINDNIEKQYLKKISEEELRAFTGRKWFLPMFSVQNPNKPSKIRIVYDAAARFEGIAIKRTGQFNIAVRCAVTLS
jgi:hypothetical protein